MNNTYKSIVMAVYALVVIGSGIYRIVSQEGGTTGLYFGLVMGGIAAAASVLFWMNKNFLAYLDTFLSISLVGGWFCYESFVKKGLGDAEPRQLIVIAVTAIVLILMVLPSRNTVEPSSIK